MDREQLDRAMKVGGAADVDTARKLAVMLIRQGLDMIDAIESSPDDYIHNAVVWNEDYTAKEDRHEHSDKIIRCASAIERIAYRIRIDAGIWPKDCTPTAETDDHQEFLNYICRRS